MNNARNGHTASVLSNGYVLVAGGSNSHGYLNTSELYNPLTDVWTLTGQFNDGREDHTASVLSNGQILIVGGYNLNGAMVDVNLYLSLIHI